MMCHAAPQVAPRLGTCIGFERNDSAGKAFEMPPASLGSQAAPVRVCDGTKMSTRPGSPAAEPSTCCFIVRTFGFENLDLDKER